MEYNFIKSMLSESVADNYYTEELKKINNFVKSNYGKTKRY